uniref:Uncharacterized protein n=1 Tax=viral metagenome TaxID=1070528 RepID=A0A6H1ZGJ4_9ZZZZ
MKVDIFDYTKSRIREQIVFAIGICCLYPVYLLVRLFVFFKEDKIAPLIISLVIITFFMIRYLYFNVFLDRFLIFYLVFFFLITLCIQENIYQKMDNIENE